MSFRLPIIAVALMGATLGCSSMGTRPVAQPRPQTGDQKLADNFLAHWNHNAEQIQSVVCRTVDVSGHSDGQSYTLDAMLAFQEPSNFRLTGKFLGKHEADLGSNSNEVWFWMARATPPAVYFCKRDDLANVTLPMPFHPDDLIQVLGSVPLDPKKFRFEKGFDSCVTLVSSETAPSGEPVVKRIVVDRDTGRASSFEVWNLHSDKPRILAEARILNYYDDPAGVFIPQKVKLIFPDAKTDLTIVMRSRAIEVNQIDSQWAAHLFSRGNYINSQVVDLGEEYRRRQASIQHRQDQMAQGDQPRLVNYESPGATLDRPEPVQVPATPAIPAALPASQQMPASQPVPTIAAAVPTPTIGPTEGIPQVFDGIAPGGYRPGQKIAARSDVAKPQPSPQSVIPAARSGASLTGQAEPLDPSSMIDLP